MTRPQPQPATSRGIATIEFVAVVWVFMVVVLGAAQFGLWWHAQHVVLAAAQDAARLAAAEDGTPAAGRARALDLLHAGLGRDAAGATVQVQRDGELASATVTGRLQPCSHRRWDPAAGHRPQLRRALPTNPGHPMNARTATAIPQSRERGRDRGAARRRDRPAGLHRRADRRRSAHQHPRRPGRGGPRSRPCRRQRHHPHPGHPHRPPTRPPGRRRLPTQPRPAPHNRGSRRTPRGGTLTVTASYQVPLDDLPTLGLLPGQLTLAARQQEPIDPHKSR